MSANIEILPLGPTVNLSLVEEIFFMTASIQDFSSDEARERFKYKYFGYYLEKFPELVMLAIQGEKVLGYCLGAPRTDESFYAYQPHLEVFSDLYERFPAHLHINLHPDAQGMGIGQKLFNSWEMNIRAFTQGLHIMTGPDARNVSFYRKLGLSFEDVRKFKGHDILFMGKYF